MRFTALSHPTHVDKIPTDAQFTLLSDVSDHVFYFVMAKLPEGYTSDIVSIIEKKDRHVEIRAGVIGHLDGAILHLESIGDGVALLARDKKQGQVLKPHGKVQGNVATSDIIFVCDQNDLTSIEERLHHISANIHFSDRVLMVQLDPEVVGPRMTPFVKQIISALCTRINSYKKQDDKSRLRAILLTITVGLITLLFISIAINARRNMNSQRSKQLADVLVVVEQQYEEAVNVVELNPVRARELLASVKLTLSPFLSEFGKKTSQYSTVSQWLEKIGSAEVAAYQIYKLTTAPEFFDLTLIRAGAVGNKMAAYNATKAIVDVTNKAVYTLTTDTKQAAIIAGGNHVGNNPTITIHGPFVYVVGNDGISRTQISTSSTQIVIPKDESWGEIVDIAAYAGNLYLLDKSGGRIHKYIATEDGFMPKTSYVNPGINVDLTNATRMMIDGAVWVATAQQVLKFERGAPVQFLLSGFSDSIPTIDAISTSDEEKFLYVLDKNLSRVIVFDKDGVYQSQYQWDVLKKATDIVASEKEKKLFVLIESKIYAIELK